MESRSFSHPSHEIVAELVRRSDFRVGYCVYERPGAYFDQSVLIPMAGLVRCNWIWEAWNNKSTYSHWDTNRIVHVLCDIIYWLLLFRRIPRFCFSTSWVVSLLYSSADDITSSVITHHILSLSLSCLSIHYYDNKVDLLHCGIIIIELMDTLRTLVLFLVNMWSCW